MKKIRSIVLILLSLVMFLSTTACGGGNDGGGSKDTGKVLLDKPVTFTLLTYEHPYQIFNTEANRWKEITKRTNVTLDIDVTTAANRNTKLATTLASGKMYDITRMDQSMLGDYSLSLYMDLTDYLETELPNYYKYIKDDQKAKWTNINGRHYGFIVIDGSEHEGEEFTGGILPVIRYDILEQNNLKMPTNMDEWFNVMKTLKTKYPDSTPWSGRGKTNILKYFEQINGYDRGLFYNYETEQYTIGALHSEFKDILVFMNKCYKEGILDNNFENTSSTTWDEGVSSGKIFFWIDNSGFSYSQTAAIKKTNPEGLMQVMPLMTNLNGKKNAYLFERNVYLDLYVLGNNTKHPQELRAFMNWCYSDEAKILFNYGVEGESFEYDSKGNIKWMDSVVQKYKNNASPDYAINGEYGLGQLSFTPLIYNNSELSKQLGTYNNTAQKILKSDYDNGYLREQISVPPPLAEDIRTTIEGKRDLIEQTLNGVIPDFVTGKRPLTEWDTIVAQIKKLGAEDVIKAYNDALKAAK